MFSRIQMNKLQPLAINFVNLLSRRSCFLQAQTETKANKIELVLPNYVQLSEDLQSEPKEIDSLVKSMILHEDFLSEKEEEVIMAEIEPYLKRMRYEFDHWDDAIHGYRETERLKWQPENMAILSRVRNLAFPPNIGQIKFVHILDLDAKGYIKPHIDAVRFCGDTIAGLSLLTDSVMRLTHEKRKNLSMDVLLKRRSLYIMNQSARYNYTHEILRNEDSVFKGGKVEKTRRVAVICRNEPNPADVK